MKIGGRSILLLTMVGFLCACTGMKDSFEAENEDFRIEYLQRIIAIDDADYFKTPLKTRLDYQSSTGYLIPVSLNKAIEYLTDALPHTFFANQSLGHEQACKLTKSSEIDEFSLKCGAQLCVQLPIEDRDSSCTFFTQLMKWVEVAWLNGPCVRSDWSSTTRLSSSLSNQGIAECYDMSSLIVDAFLIRMSGEHLNTDKILELYRLRATE